MTLRAAILDLGNVLVAFDHRITCRALAGPAGLPEDEVHARLFRSGLERDFDLGPLYWGGLYELAMLAEASERFADREGAPALLANAQALQAGDEQMETSIDGQPWVQPVFPYQAKCLQWINTEYQKLGSNGQGQVDALFDGTGCDTIIFK